MFQHREFLFANELNTILAFDKAFFASTEAFAFHCDLRKFFLVFDVRFLG